MVSSICILNLYNGFVKEKAKLGIFILLPIACWSIRWCAGPSQGLPHLMMQKRANSNQQTLKHTQHIFIIYPNIIQYQWWKLGFPNELHFLFQSVPPLWTYWAVFRWSRSDFKSYDIACSDSCLGNTPSALLFWWFFLEVTKNVFFFASRFSAKKETLRKWRFNSMTFWVNVPVLSEKM